MRIEVSLFMVLFLACSVKEEEEHSLFIELEAITIDSFYSLYPADENDSIIIPDNIIFRLNIKNNDSKRHHLKFYSKLTGDKDTTEYCIFRLIDQDTVPLLTLREDYYFDKYSVRDIATEVPYSSYYYFDELIRTGDLKQIKKIFDAKIVCNCNLSSYAVKISDSSEFLIQYYNKEIRLSKSELDQVL